jgi:hypothetical protein
VSRARPGGGGARTFLDFVVEEGVYFHPFGWGGGWPKTPPNFMGFRWDSKLQRVQRVVDHEVIPDLQTRWPDIPIIDDTGRPHVVYQLGPPLRMEAIPTGKPYRAIRFKVLLDQLLTCETLADAHAHSEILADTVSRRR